MRKGLKDRGCNRAIMVAHNANFDHSFMMAAAERAGLKRNPFHPFATFDTAALSGRSSARRCWRKPVKRPASPLTPVRRTLRFTIPSAPQNFCELVNRWKRLGGWPPLPVEDEEPVEEALKLEE